MGGRTLSPVHGPRGAAMMEGCPETAVARSLGRIGGPASRMHPLVEAETLYPVRSRGKTSDDPAEDDQNRLKANQEEWIMFSTWKFLAHAAFIVLAGAIPGSARAAAHQVIVRAFEFDPADLVIAQGDSVVWTWESGTHTVTEGSDCVVDDPLFDEEIYPSRPTFVYRFDEPGEYPYFCKPHCVFVGMEAIVRVAGAGDVDLAIPRQSGSVSAWPNPARHGAVLYYHARAAGNAIVEILDAAGRARQTLSVAAAGPGLRSIAWDGTDEAGARLGPGVYFVRVTGVASGSTTLVVL